MRYMTFDQLAEWTARSIPEDTPTEQVELSLDKLALEIRLEIKQGQQANKPRFILRKAYRLFLLSQARKQEIKDYDQPTTKAL